MATAVKNGKKAWESDQDPRWCPGCGDYAILNAVAGFMPEVGLPPERVVFIAGIGCAGRFAYYMNTYGVHGIHGRALPLATGLAVTRPDVSTQVRFRKEEEMRAGAARMRADGFAGELKVLTSCPSCLQGLARYRDDAGTDADYVVVEIARHVLGPDWLRDYVARANRGGIERVLL